MNKYINNSLLILHLFFLIYLVYLISIGQIVRDWYSLLLLVLLIIVFSFRGKWVWLLGVGICIYGIYDFVFTGFIAAEPTTMQCTTYILRDINSGTKKIFLMHLNFWFPLFFYSITLVYMMLNPTRKFYRLSSP